MDLDRETLRRNVEAHIVHARSRGLWEDRYVDFKRDLEPSPVGLAKAMKLILAFANTPRNREAYIIYGVDESSQPAAAHVGIDIEHFPSKERIEQLLHEYTALEDIVVDSELVLDGKRTPYIAIPLQYQGPYRVRRALAHAPKVIRPEAVYLRAGSRIVTAGELELRKMQDWGTWFLDGRYVSSLDDLEHLIRRVFQSIQMVEHFHDHLRFTALRQISDSIGSEIRVVLGHAYPGLETLSPDHVKRLQADNVPTVHDRWLVCHQLHPTAVELARAEGIRVLTVGDLYIGMDVYGRYCRAYLDDWAHEKAASGIGTVVDLDFREHTQTLREKSVLAWLETALQDRVALPTVIYGEFGTGKSVTMRQLVADICDDYLRRSTSVRAIYVNLNSIDVRADRRSFVERALYALPLRREDIDELVRLVDGERVSLVLDGVDEMARPHSMAGRKEAFQLISENLNRRPCVLTVRPNYFGDNREMFERIGELSPYASATRERRYRAAELCDLTPVQVEHLLSAGLAEQDEAVDAKGLAAELARGGLGSFLRDPLVLSLAIERLRTTKETDLGEHRGRLSLVATLLDGLIEREIEKRRKARGPLTPERFHELLERLAYVMVRDDDRIFKIDQVALYVAEDLKRTEEPAGKPAEMAEQFRTQTWLHADGDGYRFRHEVFTHVLAAQYVRRSLLAEGIDRIRDWNPEAVSSGTVVAYVRELLNPQDVLQAAACVSLSSLTAGARTLILEVLRDIDQSAEVRRRPNYLDTQGLRRVLGPAIKAAVEEAHIAGAVVSCIAPAVAQSNLALLGSLCFLAVAKTPQAQIHPAILAVIRELSDVRDSHGHLRKFEDVLAELRTEVGPGQNVLKSTGLDVRALTDPFSYEPLFCALNKQLPPNCPDAATWRYIAHAAQYLADYRHSKEGIPGSHARR